MMRCRDVRDSIHLYIDGELTPSQEFEFEAHLIDCESCRREHDDLRQVVNTVRGARPLFEPSPALRGKLEQIVAASAGPKRGAQWLRVGIPVAAAACILLTVSLLPGFHKTGFTAYAADVHQRFVNGRLPLDFRSEVPGEASAWLSTRVAFHMSVPNYPSEPGELKAYRLTGTRLMQYDGEDVAYLAYLMNGHPVSVLVGSSRLIVPSGDDVYRSGNLLFHFSAKNGYQLITWRDRDLVYAVVSDVQAGKAESCIVCHGSAAEVSRLGNMSPERHN